MDLGTIIGLIMGLAMVTVGILVGGASPMLYVDVSSVFITIGGSFAALLVMNPMSRVLGLMRYFNHASSCHQHWWL